MTTDPEPIAAPAAEPRRRLQLRLFGRTDVGLVREHNEDAFVVADLTRGGRGVLERLHEVGEGGILLGVCDGMGGAAAGEVASRLAVDIVSDAMQADELARGAPERAGQLVCSMESAGWQIWKQARENRSRRGMGTTATMALVLDDRVFVGQVGDSRAYVLRGERLVQVTRDQSLVSQLVETGQLTLEEAETFEHKNIILQALGTAGAVDVDLSCVDLRRGDTLMICSDGLSGMVSDEEIRDALRAFDDPFEACRVLTELAEQAGGHDNITVIVAKVEGELDEPTPNDVDQLRYERFEVAERPPEALGSAPELGSTPDRGGESSSAFDSAPPLALPTHAVVPPWMLVVVLLAGLVALAGWLVD